MGRTSTEARLHNFKDQLLTDSGGVLTDSGGDLTDCGGEEVEYSGERGEEERTLKNFYRVIKRKSDSDLS